jgi:hypothetical protein
VHLLRLQRHEQTGRDEDQDETTCHGAIVRCAA